MVSLIFSLSPKLEQKNQSFFKIIHINLRDIVDAENFLVVIKQQTNIILHNLLFFPDDL